MNLRADLKLAQERLNAEYTAVKSRSKIPRMFGIPFAVAFVFMLLALAAPPASAAVDINGTIGPIITDVTELVPSIIELIVAIVPAVIVLGVVGFIIAFLDRILAMMKI